MTVHVSWRVDQRDMESRKASCEPARQRVGAMSHIVMPGEGVGMYSDAFSRISA